VSGVRADLRHTRVRSGDRALSGRCGARETVEYTAFMVAGDELWKLEHLSDAQLLESLGGLLRARRRALAELVAHLGEVEDRRLHLEAAYSSMFAYCVARLNMSEDEACRRIEVARMARKYPAIFAELASGRLTLSVALVLKPVLSPSNHLALLAAARGKCIRQARELVAERFPKADAPSSIRKLPERRSAAAAEPAQACLPTSLPAPSSAGSPPPSVAASTRTSPSSALDLVASPALCEIPMASSVMPDPARSDMSAPATPSDVPLQSSPPPRTSSASPAASSSTAAEPAELSPPPRTSSASPAASSSTAAEPAELSPSAERHAGWSATRDGFAPRGSRGVIEPLSAQRYRVQFTADAELKQKLEQARDLLRHAHPSGDFAPIVSRALDLLIDELLRRRFGANARRERPSPAPATAAPAPSAATAERAPASVAPTPSVATASAAPAPSEASAAGDGFDTSAPAARAPAPEAARSGYASAAVTSSSTPLPTHRPHIPRAARRAALERDGLACSWVGADGARCGSQAWLQLDHREPVGKGGASGPDNLRLLCRAHNLLAAEHAYGREHMERKTRRQRTDQQRDPPARGHLYPRSADQHRPGEPGSE